MRNKGERCNTVRFAPQSQELSQVEPCAQTSNNHVSLNGGSFRSRRPNYMIIPNDDDSAKVSTRFFPKAEKEATFLDDSNDDDDDDDGDDDQSEAIAISALASLGHARCESKSTEEIVRSAAFPMTEQDELKSIISTSTYGSKKYCIGVDNYRVGRDVSEMTLDTVDETSEDEVDDTAQITSYDASCATSIGVRPLNEGSDVLFPKKLFAVLSQNENTDVITWLPSGKSFVVLQPQVLVHNILRRNFSGLFTLTKFLRELKRWGFEHRSDTDEGVIYSHRFFRRDSPSLCLQMSCSNEMIRPRHAKQYVRNEPMRQHASTNRQVKNIAGYDIDGYAEKSHFQEFPREHKRRHTMNSKSTSMKRHPSWKKDLVCNADFSSRGRRSEDVDELRSGRIKSNHFLRRSSCEKKRKENETVTSKQYKRSLPEEECYNVDITSQILDLRSSRASKLSRALLRKYVPHSKEKDQF